MQWKNKLQCDIKGFTWPDLTWEVKDLPEQETLTFEHEGEKNLQCIVLAQFFLYVLLDRC